MQILKSVLFVGGLCGGYIALGRAIYALVDLAHPFIHGFYGLH